MCATGILGEREEAMTTYDKDFFQWTQETARAIEAGRFDEIDLAALADEVAVCLHRHRFDTVSCQTETRAKKVTCAQIG
jgi:hypothetical protein